jgi:hypothetical protein
VATLYRPLSLRSVILLAILVAGVSLAIALLAAPAGALVMTVEGTKVGIQPRSTLLGGSEINLNEKYALEPSEFNNPQGNTIVSASKIYAIYWDPTDHYHSDWQHVIDTFLQSLGHASGHLDNVFAVDAQYTDAANEHALYKSTFQGAYTDTDSYPSSGCTDPEPLNAADLIGPEVSKKHTQVCLTDRQIQQELELFITQHSLHKGMETIFYILTPPGVTACLGSNASSCSDYKKAPRVNGESKEEEEEKNAEELASFEKSFCSYHSDMSASNSSGGEDTLLYGVIPWTAGGLGDYHLTENDRTSAFDCQDGGYDPSSKPVEKREKKKEKDAKEIAEDAEKSLEERVKVAEAELLEGPHPQEPNQVKCPSSDGACDVGLADLIINQIAVEQQNIVTDPLLDAWQDPHGNEATDECRDWFAPVVSGNVGAQEGSLAGTLYDQMIEGNSYYLNTAFNLSAYKLPYPGISCIPSVSLLPQFTAPNTVNANETVGFDGMESDITLNADTVFPTEGAPHIGYATYTWNFGDGSAPVTGFAPGAPQVNSPGVSPCGAAEWEAPCAASSYHSYQYGGIYEVSLTVTDTGGNTATVKEPITVIGPPAPSPEPPPTPTPTPTPTPPPTPSTTPTSGGSGGPGGGSSSTGQTSATTPAPVLGAAVTSKSLKKALKSGLPVQYTTNEQVAGNIEVLLESAIAKKLGVKGATATGLPAGTPKSIVVGSAVLVTTKAGHGTIRIKFTSRAAARLKHTRKLKVMLRLFARNASRQSPQTTTMLSTVVLNP